MKRKSKILALSILATGLMGCTTVVTKDYGQYLANNSGQSRLDKVNIGNKYYLTPATQNHKASFRSGTAGIANSWVIEFGPVIEETLKSQDMVDALGRLEEVGSPDGKDSVLIIDLKNYDFRDHGAHVTLTMELKKGAKSILQKTYSASGITQGGKMFWGGAMAMKNAVHQSTKSALDQIFGEFVRDVQKVK